MNTLGQLALLIALVASGYAAFACVAGSSRHRAIRRSGTWAAVVAVAALTGVTGVLVRALLAKDFTFAYVAQYCDRLLPWPYCLSALWVGQAGSLLLWAWLLGVLTMAYRFWPGGRPSPIRRTATGILIGNCCFLVAVMVFAADPMAPSLSTPSDGAGLSPLLHHPVMLIHPPLILLGYAGWTVPFALALAALIVNRTDTGWIRDARRWALFSWAVLGGGILLGGWWAYEELGWGGYWGWDPVENGSLLPWLTGTALIHALMVWQYRGGFRKTSLLLAVGTFALCNFATFLTRSGVFGGLHTFSQSPIGWMFLALTAGSLLAGVVLVAMRRSPLQAKGTIAGIWAREAWIAIALAAWLSLATAVLVGTALLPASSMLLGRRIVVGPDFYNNVLIATGLLLLAATAAAPLLRWGKPPLPGQWIVLSVATVAGGSIAATAMVWGVRSPTALGVAGLATATAVALAGMLAADARRGPMSAPYAKRREYAGFLVHLGFVCLAVGVTGSSLGTRRQEVVLSEGETAPWAGQSVRCTRLIRRELPGKVVEEVQLDVFRQGVHVATLVPGQHLHLLQNEWTTEVAVDSSWRGDLYAILHGGAGEGRVDLTLIENPMMRWIWLGGWIAGAGALAGLCTRGRRSRPPPTVPAPKWIGRKQRNTMAPADDGYQDTRP